MVLVAALAAGAVGVTAVGLGQLASADRPSVSEEPVEPTSALVETTEDDTTNDEPAPDDGDETPTIDGEIVIDPGDGEPFVVDLGAVTACLPDFGALPGLEAFPELEEFPEWDDFPAFEEFTEFELDGTTITIVGPNGTEVVTLGEDGSVTITSEDGELSVETDGDATVDDLFGDLDELFDDEAFGDLDDLFGESLDELFGDFFDEEFLEDLEDLDLDEFFSFEEGSEGDLGELFGDLDDCIRDALEES